MDNFQSIPNAGVKLFEYSQEAKSNPKLHLIKSPPCMAHKAYKIYIVCIMKASLFFIPFIYHTAFLKTTRSFSVLGSIKKVIIFYCLELLFCGISEVCEALAATWILLCAPFNYHHKKKSLISYTFSASCHSHKA